MMHIVDCIIPPGVSGGIIITLFLNDLKFSLIFLYYSDVGFSI